MGGMQAAEKGITHSGGIAQRRPTLGRPAGIVGVLGLARVNGSLALCRSPTPTHLSLGHPAASFLSSQHRRQPPSVPVPRF